MSFAQAFALTISPSVENSTLSMVRSDPGNWSGGAVGDGQLQGTKAGISAAFLHGLREGEVGFGLLPAQITPLDAQEIYRRHFWDAVSGDALPPPVGGLLFDGAVNQGPGWAPLCLQAAVGAYEDGDIGPGTLAAVKATAPATLHAEIARLRDARYRASPDWTTFGVGWSRRLMTVVAATASFT